MKFTITAALFARDRLCYPRLLNTVIGLIICLYILSVISILKPFSLDFFVVLTLFFMCILTIFIGHRLYPTKAVWLFLILLLVLPLFRLISTLPEVYHRTDYLTNYIIGILFCFFVIVSIAVQGSYAFLKLQKYRIVVSFVFLLYIFAIWLTLGIDRVASDDGVVNFNEFFKHRLTFRIHYENPAWKGLELIPHDKLTHEEHIQHIKYCEVRFGVADIAECDKKFLQ